MTTWKMKVFYENKASAADQTHLHQLPCSHYADVFRLKEWIKVSLQKGLHSFPCTRCNGTRIPWQTLRQLVDFTPEQLKLIEQMLVDNCRNNADELKKCPLCARLVQTCCSEVLCVECPGCPGCRGDDYRFCWDCRREWKGPSDPGVSCPHPNCGSVALLQSCLPIERPGSEVDECPSVRACPRCQLLMAHRDGCNNVVCPACGCRFCYRCLQTNLHYRHSCTILSNPLDL